MTEINDKAQLDIAAADDTDAVTSDTPEETVNTPEVDETFELSAAKMREHGMSETVINQFRHLYDVWRHEEASSWIREDDIEPLGHVPSFHDVYETINHDKAVDAFAKTAFLKLNGGLGTSMGLDKAKSLLPVRRHKAKQMRFIDIIIGQVLTARTRLNVELPLTFMNSFHTSADTMKVLKHHRKFSQHDVPMEIIQHQEPKLVAATGDQGLQLDPLVHDQGCSPLGTAGLVRRNRQCMHASRIQFAEGQRQFAQRLHGVGVEPGTTPPGLRCQLGNSLQGTGFVVGQHHRQQSGPR